MTVTELRTILATSLASLLGTYTLTSGATVPAIYVGDPPSDWTASGLECRIAIDPSFAVTTLQNREANLAMEYDVRLVQHGPGSLTPAVERIVRRFTDAGVTRIPPNEGLGILAQVTITIPR